LRSSQLVSRHAQNFDGARRLLHTGQNPAGRFLGVFLLTALLANESGNIPDHPDIPLVFMHKGRGLFNQLTSAKDALFHHAILSAVIPACFWRESRPYQHGSPTGSRHAR
jgi:hypothetical protein